MGGTSPKWCNPSIVGDIVPMWGLLNGVDVAECSAMDCPHPYPRGEVVSAQPFHAAGDMNASVLQGAQLDDEAPFDELACEPCIDPAGEPWPKARAPAPLTMPPAGDAVALLLLAMALFRARPKAFADGRSRP